MVKQRIAVITATRADFGLLRPLIKVLSTSESFDLKLIVTGSHLSPEFGVTINEIIDSGFLISNKIEIILSSDSPCGIGKSFGLASLGLSDVFSNMSLDAIVLLGDRYEILSAASVASIFRIPIIHLHGGELSEGSLDDSFRHAITKLSRIHFASTETHKMRIVSMGENPDFVFNVGAIGVDSILSEKPLGKQELEAFTRISLASPYYLTTFHPETSIHSDSSDQISAIIEAMLMRDNRQIIITQANADEGGRLINDIIGSYQTKFPERIFSCASLGQIRYLSAMKYAHAVVGNSSSGIIETPSFGIPTINVGSRQKGREHGPSIINCASDIPSIKNALDLADSTEFRKLCKSSASIYGNGTAAKSMYGILSRIKFSELGPKKFYEHRQLG